MSAAKFKIQFDVFMQYIPCRRTRWCKEERKDIIEQ